MPDKKQNKLFCFGYGYVAHALATALQKNQNTWNISGTTRSVDKMRLLKSMGVKATLFDSDQPLGDAVLMLDGVTHLLITIPPSDSGCPVFEAHVDEIVALMPGLKWVGLISSTSVYGDRDGALMDETSERRPTNRRGSRRSLAEAQWLAKFSNDRLPLHIFRLAGVYGPGRSALDAVRAGNSRRIYKPGHAFSRMHIDDVLQTFMASINQPHAGDIYNLSDDLPSPSHELIKLACELLGRDVPPLLSFDDVDMAPMARSFYLDNKRISNRKIKEILGVTLKYPTYVEGLSACLAAEQNGTLPDPLFMGDSINAG